MQGRQIFSGKNPTTADQPTPLRPAPIAAPTVNPSPPLQRHSICNILYYKQSIGQSQTQEAASRDLGLKISADRAPNYLGQLSVLIVRLMLTFGRLRNGK